MTVTRKVVLGIVGGVVFVAVGFACVVMVFKVANRQSAIDCTLEWGRLAPFPASAEQFSITTHGNMFTREFRASFMASPAEIERWLQESPGTRQTLPTTPSPGVRKFEIKPGGGAQFAEVSVDDVKHQVFIVVSWS